MHASRSAILVAACALLAAMAPAARATQYEYDALNRVTRVTHDNGTSVSYTYDAAGNITSVITRGRSSAVVSARLGSGSGNPARGTFTFRASQGEAVTLRFEADPRQAGAGKYVKMTLKARRAGARATDTPRMIREVLSAVPAELTSVLPFTGSFVVDVWHAGDQGIRYEGPYRLTLEASPAACASLK